MKLSKTLLSLVVASTVAISSASLAATPDVVALQKGKIEQLNVESQILMQQNQAHVALASTLGTAKVKAAGYQVLVKYGDKGTTYGGWGMLGAGGARVYQHIAKQRGQFVNRGKRPMEILLALSVLAFGAGVAGEFKGQEWVDVSAAEVEGIITSLNASREEMIHRRAMMVTLAQELGAKVSQHVTTTEDIKTISGLEGLQTLVGSGLLQLPVPMMIPQINLGGQVVQPVIQR